MITEKHRSLAWRWCTYYTNRGRAMGCLNELLTQHHGRLLIWTDTENGERAVFEIFSCESGVFRLTQHRRDNFVDGVDRGIFPSIKKCIDKAVAYVDSVDNLRRVMALADPKVKISHAEKILSRKGGR